VQSGVDEYVLVMDIRIVWPTVAVDGITVRVTADTVVQKSQSVIASIHRVKKMRLAYLINIPPS
jgi:hypothetical protein